MVITKSTLFCQAIITQRTQENATDCRRESHTDSTKKAIIKLRNKTQIDEQDYLQAKLALVLASARKLMGLVSDEDPVSGERLPFSEILPQVSL